MLEQRRREPTIADLRTESDLDVLIDPARVLRGLLITIGVLLLLSSAGQVMVYSLPDFPLRDSFVALFYLDTELSVPALFSSGMHLAGAVLCAVIAYARKRVGHDSVRYWIGLSMLFVFMAIDEQATLHERTIPGLRKLLDIEGGILWYAWAVLGALAVAVIGLVLLPFLRRLPRTTRRRLWAAGVLFVGGAIGLELPGGLYASSGGEFTPSYVLIATAEETLEMLGLATFIYALVAYLPAAAQGAAWRVRVTES